MMRRSIWSVCLVLGLVRSVAADSSYDIKRESAWARQKWAGDLKGVRFGTPVKELLAWVPAGTSIDAWAFSPSHRCDRVELRQLSDSQRGNDGDVVLVGETIVDQKVDRGREFRAWKLYSFGAVFAEGAEALRVEERDANGTWRPAGETGTIGRENVTYGALTYVDANVARFRGTPVVLHAECAGPVDWLPCQSGGERPCIGCKTISVTPVEANAYYDGQGFNWGRRQPTCHDPCPRTPANPAVARLDALQSHITIWQPSGERLADTPSLHRTQAHCMRTHFSDGSQSARDRLQP